MVIDERFVKALHVETLHREGLGSGLQRHVLFQASTIGALLDGAYDGDVSFAELAAHGDLGLGTLNGLDGEMIALDGRFYRADVDGVIYEIDPGARTPFAVVVRFSAAVDFLLAGPISHDELCVELDRRLPAGAGACALRIDGTFELIRARSVPGQRHPYRPLVEVIEDQHVFDLGAVDGTIVGFRFPDHGGGIEASGYHLHFIDAELVRGGHVLDCRVTSARVRIDPSNELRIELPPGVDLSEPHLDRSMSEALRRVEG